MRYLLALIMLWVPFSSYGTNWIIPMDEDFEGFTSTSDMWNSSDCWINVTGTSCQWQISQHGNSNEYLLDKSDGFNGNNSMQFVMDNLNDPEAYRAEGQTHYSANQYMYINRTYWIGFAIKAGANNPTTDRNWVDVMGSLKVLNSAGTTDICHIGFLNRINGTGNIGYRNESYYCNGHGKEIDSGIHFDFGQWYRIVVRAEMGDSGSYRMWVNQDSMGTPDVEDTGGLFENCCGGASNKVYAKVGLYKTWFAARNHPEDRIFAQWRLNYDDWRLCEEGVGACSNAANAFAWVNPTVGTVPPPVTVPAHATKPACTLQWSPPFYYCAAVEFGDDCSIERNQTVPSGSNLVTELCSTIPISSGVTLTLNGTLTDESGNKPSYTGSGTCSGAGC